MENWSGDENQIMKGYVMRAVKELNEDYMYDSGKIAIDKKLLDELFCYLHRVCNNLTADEAQHYYLNHDTGDVCEKLILF